MPGWTIEDVCPYTDLSCAQLFIGTDSNGEPHVGWIDTYSPHSIWYSWRHDGIWTEPEKVAEACDFIPNYDEQCIMGFSVNGLNLAFAWTVPRNETGGHTGVPVASAKVYQATATVGGLWTVSLVYDVVELYCAAYHTGEYLQRMRPRGCHVAVDSSGRTHILFMLADYRGIGQYSQCGTGADYWSYIVDDGVPKLLLATLALGVEVLSYHSVYVDAKDNVHCSWYQTLADPSYGGYVSNDMWYACSANGYALQSVWHDETPYILLWPFPQGITVNETTDIPYISYMDQNIGVCVDHQPWATVQNLPNFSSEPGIGFYHGYLAMPIRLDYGTEMVLAMVRDVPGEWNISDTVLTDPADVGHHTRFLDLAISRCAWISFFDDTKGYIRVAYKCAAEIGPYWQII